MAHRIFLASAREGGMGSEDFHCEVWADLDARNGRIATCICVGNLSIQDGKVSFDIEGCEAEFQELVERAPICNHLHLAALVMFGLNGHFDEDCETYMDCFARGDVTCAYL